MAANVDTSTETTAELENNWYEALGDKIGEELRHELAELVAKTGEEVSDGLEEGLGALFKSIIENITDFSKLGDVLDLMDDFEGPAILAGLVTTYAIIEAANVHTVLDEIRAEATAAKNYYQNRESLADYAASAHGRSLILDAVVKSTLPTFLATRLSDASAAASNRVLPASLPDSDFGNEPLVFQVTNDAIGTATSASFGLYDWHGMCGQNQTCDGPLFARIHDGWLVEQRIGTDAGRYVPRIEYLASDGLWRAWLDGSKFLAERVAVYAGGAEAGQGAPETDCTNALSVGGLLLYIGGLPSDLGQICLFRVPDPNSVPLQARDTIAFAGEVRSVDTVYGDGSFSVTVPVTHDTGDLRIFTHPDGDCVSTGASSLGSSRVPGPDCISSSTIHMDAPCPDFSCSGGAGTYGSQTVTLVSRPTLTITASSPTVTYGDAAPMIVPTYSGFVGGDTADSLTTLPTCSTSYQAGVSPGAPPSSVSTQCSGAADLNYVIEYVGGTVTVKPAPLTVTAPSPEITYGGAVPVLAPTYSGFVNGEKAASLTTQATCSTTAVNTSPVGTYPSTCSGATDPNYTISYVPGTVKVNPAPLTITASSGMMTYGGTAPTISPIYSGFVNSDSAASLTTQPTCSTTAVSASPVGSYPSTCSGATDPNYAIAYVPGTVKVDPAPLTITASNGTMVIGGTPPTISPSYNGFVNSESASSLTTQPTCSTAATSGSAVGTYPSTCSGAADPNYAISYVSGSVTVTYGQTQLGMRPVPSRSGSELPIMVELLNANGANLSSSAITLTLVSPAVTPDPSPGVEPTGTFAFHGRMYQYRLSTRGYPAGNYTLSFTMTGDPTVHTVPFAVR